VPQRIQLSRKAGWRKPEGCIVVARPGPYGNPFPIEGDWITWTAVGLGYHGNAAGRRECAVAMFRAWISGANGVKRKPIETEGGGALGFSDGSVVALGDHVANLALEASSWCEAPRIPAERPDLAPLRGHDLACWCPLVDVRGNPVLCHADVLLELVAQ